jgi:hypothetical protein
VDGKFPADGKLGEINVAGVLFFMSLARIIAKNILSDYWRNINNERRCKKNEGNKHSKHHSPVLVFGHGYRDSSFDLYVVAVPRLISGNFRRFKMNIERFTKAILNGKPLVVICCVCRLARDINGNWHQATFDASVDISHTYCPKCKKAALAELMAL